MDPAAFMEDRGSESGRWAEDSDFDLPTVGALMAILPFPLSWNRRRNVNERIALYATAEPRSLVWKGGHPAM